MDQTAPRYIPSTYPIVQDGSNVNDFSSVGMADWLRPTTTTTSSANTALPTTTITHKVCNNPTVSPLDCPTVLPTTFPTTMPWYRRSWDGSPPLPPHLQYNNMGSPADSSSSSAGSSGGGHHGGLSANLSPPHVSYPIPMASSAGSMASSAGSMASSAGSAAFSSGEWFGLFRAVGSWGFDAGPISVVAVIRPDFASVFSE